MRDSRFSGVPKVFRKAKSFNGLIPSGMAAKAKSGDGTERADFSAG
jgi:hypothetical protein